MAKRALLIGMSLVILTLALLAQAQDATPDSQATVDAAVSTLIAQTQQAPQMLMTQTIHAALAQALTATAQPAQPTETPVKATEQPFDASSLSIAGTTDLDLLAGPAATSAYLAPDGEHFAYLKGKTLCIYARDQQQNCTDLSDAMRRIDSESIRWSPDSRYIVLTEEFFRSFTEPDIWVFDTTTSTIKDITDDGVSKIELGSSTWKNIDIVPHWTPDGQIIFLRYSRLDGQITAPEIHQIAPDGSAETTLGTLNSNDDPFAIYNFDIGHDKLVYAYTSQARSASDGVWISDLDGQNARQLSHQPETALLTGMKLSPDERFILVNMEQRDFAAKPTPENSRMVVVDSSSGEQILIDPEQNVSGAGWSPTGSALVYITRSLEDSNDNPVFLTNTPGVGGRQLTSLEGTFNMATPLLQQTLGWGANNTILLSHSPTTGIVLVHLE
ncbi:MAG: hypothetical protein GC204_13260 [Chloroflexi bacterium]|nr:hypothetical protein [Chloroflexota bacterium]